MFGLQAELAVRETPEEAILFIKITDPPEQQILESLHNGTRSEILYHIKVYAETSGLASFLPDKLLAEYKILREASIQKYDGSYLISDGSRQDTFLDERLFLESFLNLRDFRIPSGRFREQDENDTVYILVRVTLSTIKLIPPMTILKFFLPESRMTSPWTRKTLTLPRRQ